MNDSPEEKEQKEPSLKMHPNFQCRGSNRPQRPLIGGIIIILVGLALLLQKIPGISAIIPPWLFTWPMILILIGIFAAIKNRNLVSGGIPFLIGLFFLLTTNGIINASLQPFLIPILIILFGVFLILHRNNRSRFMAFKNEIRRQRRDYFRHQKANSRHSWHNASPFSPPPPPPFPPETGENIFNGASESQQDSASTNAEDYLDINSVFGSSEKKYFSKDFKGGNINCLFGGSKVNLIHSDIQDKAVLNFSINFGGTELYVPANWIIVNEINVLFAGIEDKRFISPPVPGDNKKILILRGNVFCGGIEIRS